MRKLGQTRIDKDTQCFWGGGVPDLREIFFIYRMPYLIMKRRMWDIRAKVWHKYRDFEFL